MQKLVLLLSMLFLVACTEQVNINTDSPAELMVVDGSVQADAAVHQVKLSRSRDIDKRVFEPLEGATLRLRMIDGPTGTFEEMAPGVYELNGELVPGEVGKAYTLKIILADGKEYESLPEVIPARMKIDSLSFENVRVDLVNDLGNIIQRKFVELRVHSTLPDFNEGPFVRWEVEDIYKVTERLCGPNPQTCYIYPPDFIPPIKLLKGDDYSPGLPIAETLVRRSIDYWFGERYSFSVYQTTHTKAAFDYWAKIDLLVSLEGSIFDRPPAPVNGNVFSVDDPSEEVLGYFSGVAVDTAHLFMSRFDVLDFEPVQPLCGIPGFPLNGSFNVTACCNCLSLDYSTYDRPDFW